MECFLVYEFVYFNFDEDIHEEIEFFGLYSDRETANKVAQERIKYGIEHCDVIIDPELPKQENIFEHIDNVYMYRDNVVYMCRDNEEIEEPPIYSINIKKFNLEGRN